jgi:hypothetical protein
VQLEVLHTIVFELEDISSLRVPELHLCMSFLCSLDYQHGAHHVSRARDI